MSLTTMMPNSFCFSRGHGWARMPSSGLTSESMSFLTMGTSLSRRSAKTTSTSLVLVPGSYSSMRAS